MVNYLVIATADFCGACKHFKNNGQLKSIKDYFSDKSDIKIITIEFLTGKNSNRAEIEAAYPRLKPYIRVFPTFLLVNSSWDNPNSKLELAAAPITLDDDLNVVKNNNNYVYLSGFQPTSDSVIKWVENNLKDNKYFKNQNKPQKSAVKEPQYMANKSTTKRTRTTIPKLSESSGNGSSNGTYRLIITDFGVDKSNHKIPTDTGQKIVQSFQNKK